MRNLKTYICIGTQSHIITAALNLIMVLLAAASWARADDTIHVVTTIPDLADMARAVGGEQVTVKSLTKGTEDMHMIPMKPSYLLLLNKADMLLEMGLDMEHAWLPDLLYNCRNDRIQPGAPGFVNCSAHIEVVEAQKNPDRSEGEVHPEGNPHYNVDPSNGRLMAMTLCDGLCRAYPQHAERFKANLHDYVDLLQKKMKVWDEMAKPLKGLKVVTYHRSWSYFVKHFGMEVIGEIEPKPGIAPTAGHLAKLIRKIREEGADLVIKETYYSDQYPELLKEKTGIPFVNLPNMSGGMEETATYIQFIEYNLKTVLKALGMPVSKEEKECHDEG
ncbi:MAG: metal ABC transporter substrate-binding protein [Planctomycetota bacterium]